MLDDLPILPQSDIAPAAGGRSIPPGDMTDDVAGLIHIDQEQVAGGGGGWGCPLNLILEDRIRIQMVRAANPAQATNRVGVLGLLARWGSR